MPISQSFFLAHYPPYTCIILKIINNSPCDSKCGLDNKQMVLEKGLFATPQRLAWGLLHLHPGQPACSVLALLCCDYHARRRP